MEDGEGKHLISQNCCRFWSRVGKWAHFRSTIPAVHFFSFTFFLFRLLPHIHTLACAFSDDAVPSAGNSIFLFSPIATCDRQIPTN